MKNPYYQMSDFNYNPTKEQVEYANKFNKMVASVTFNGEKYREDFSHTEEYSLYLRWKTQTNMIIMTKESHDRLQLEMKEKCLKTMR
jgi:hypothetical protein